MSIIQIILHIIRRGTSIFTDLDPPPLGFASVWCNELKIKFISVRANSKFN